MSPRPQTSNVVRLFSEPRPPVVQRRRGRYPKGVVRITTVPKLKVGALVETVGIDKHTETNGVRGVITDYDGRSPWGYCVRLEREIICKDGKPGRDVWFKEKNLRRVWDWRKAEDIKRMRREQR